MKKETGPWALLLGLLASIVVAIVIGVILVMWLCQPANAQDTITVYTPDQELQAKYVTLVPEEHKTYDATNLSEGSVTVEFVETEHSIVVYVQTLDSIPRLVDIIRIHKDQRIR